MPLVETQLTLEYFQARPTRERTAATLEAPMPDTDEIAIAIAAWETWAVTTANAEAARLARRTIEALRQEQDDGLARCTCCLLPFGTQHA